MIRTRDAVIFVSVILTLCVGIGFTLLLSPKYTLDEGSFMAYVEMGTTTSFTAEAPQKSLDRQSIIERLRAALLKNESDVEPSPSVEEEVVSETDEVTDEVTGVQACANDDTGAALRLWPLSGVSLISENGVRKVVHTQVVAALPIQSASSSASSTAPTSNQTALLTLPLTPLQTATSNCVPGNIIGVTVQGTLMYNNEATFYKGYGPEYLIGYARDGYPIYGFYQGATDTCGGYTHASGYRYSVGHNRDTVLNCYTASPASFTNL